MAQGVRLTGEAGRVRRLLEAAERMTATGSYEWDLVGDRLWWSPNMYALLGYDAADIKTPNTTHFFDRVHPQDLGPLRDLIDRTLRDGPTFQHVVRVLRPSGELRVLDARGDFVRTEAGSPIVMYGTVQDITDRCRLETALKAACARATEASTAKSEFLAMMSHELRTPLNVVIGFSEMMSQETFGALGDTRYTECLDAILESSRHLLEIIDTILDLSKIDAQATPTDAAPVDLTRLVRRVVQQLEPDARRGDITLLTDCAADLPSVRGDHRLLAQAFTHLLANAVKFTRAGGKVTVAAWIDRPGGHVCVDVRDTGIGMSAEAIPRALSAFSQVEGSRGRRFQGVGLGLPLAKRTVEKHGGTLTIDSVPGVGTTIAVRFPLQDPADGNAPSDVEPGGVNPDAAALSERTGA